MNSQNKAREALTCPHCAEVILFSDEIANTSGPHWHIECFFRATSGSLAHQKKECGCYVPGATHGDPEDMTPREAAKAALDWYRAHPPDLERPPEPDRPDQTSFDA